MKWIPIVLLAACSQSITRDDAGRDAGPDETDAGHDEVDAGSIEPDAGRDAGRPIETFGGSLLFSEVQGFVEIVPGTSLEVRALAPVVSFTRSTTTEVPDFTSGSCPLCCTANHFDTATDPPVPSEDAGVVTISGYTGGLFADGTTAPSSITCALEGIRYACRYAGGARVSDIAFFAATDPMRPTDTITFMVAGGGEHGTLSHSVMPVEAVAVTEDLSALTIDPMEDVTLNYTCAGGMCGFTPIVVNMAATQAGVETPTSFGSLTCIVLGGTTTTVSRQAIAAMLGCDAAGAGCDTTLNEVRTVVLRLAVPMTGIDSNGNMINPIAAGQGEFGTSTL